MRPLGLATALVLLLLGLPAQATESGGKALELLGVSGPSHRYATVAELDVQGGDCEVEPCRVYHVDLEQPTFERLAARKVKLSPSEGDLAERLFSAYQALLPKTMRRRLGQNRIPQARLARVEGRAERGKVSAKVAGRTVTARLELRWTAPSMNAFDGYDASFNRCVDSEEVTPMCSACRRTARWVDGDRLDTWVCDEKGTSLEHHDVDDQGNPVVRTCLCAARAHMYALELDDGTNERQGSKVLVEPYRTSQEPSGKSGVWLDDSGLVDGTGQSTLELVATPEGFVIAVGSAVHDPFANSSFCPVFAVLPPSSMPKRD